MTISFQGHITKLEQGHQCVDAHVQTEQFGCGQIIVLHISESDAAHWLPGRMVNFTVYAVPETKDTP